MELMVSEVDGQRIGEGAPGQPLIGRVDDVVTLLEICFGQAVNRLLFYPENLTAHFFDLSSGEAGAILQKLRTYHLRLAIMRSPTLVLSRRFAELIADEHQGSDFRMFDARSAAQEWLGHDRAIRSKESQ